MAISHIRAKAYIPVKCLVENKVCIVGCNIHILQTCSNCQSSSKCMSRFIQFPLYRVGNIKKINQNTLEIEEKTVALHRVYFADSKQLDKIFTNICQEIEDFPVYSNQVLA